MADEQATATRLDEAGDGDQQELVTCLIDNVEFGLNIHAVQEIVRLPKITPVPKAPHYVRGLANLRGNVLPVIEPRLRFGMSGEGNDDTCRMIVVEVNGTPTGMIVDAVREVLHMEDSAVEPAPPTVQGVDSKFLSGVVKLDGGKRLVMLIDQDQVVDLEDFDSEAAKDASATGSGRSSRADANAEEEQDNEQLVTFRLADEEYGFPIMDVQEIIRVPEITQVPNAPDGVQGITSLRDRVLPVMDLRTKFRFRTLAAETDSFVAKMQAFERQHAEMVTLLSDAVAGGSTVDGSFGYDDCEFADWRESFSTLDDLIESLLGPFDGPEKRLHEGLQAVASLLADGESEGALAELNRLVKPAHAEFKALFKKLFRGISHREDERCLVVSIGETSLALRLDAVNEVLRVPKSSVESTPQIVAGQGANKDQIRGVAKLNEGKRLIMILDVQKLVSEAELKAITATAGNGASQSSSEQGASSMDANTEEDERQLVVFKVAEEEFATDIMQVQEIIRLEKVTAVPHAPSFVEGVVNLRGTVLPVVDLRRRFDMEEKEYSDATRVVVVDVNDRKTGIIVDAVSEVMSLPNKSIEPAPAIVKAGYGEDFIEGVGKIDGGDRMILILRTDRLLSDEEMSAFDEAASGETPGETPDAEESEDRQPELVGAASEGGE